MKALLAQTLAILLMVATQASAQFQDLQISVTRQKLDEQKEREGGNTTVTVKEVRYKVTVENRTFKTMPELKAKYMIFYEAPVAGTKEVKEAFHKGSETIVNLEGHRSSIFETKPFKLTSSQLDGDWYYAGGANNKTKDRVAGIWIRISDPDGKLVGEYVNPSSLAKKNDFKE